jgi:2-hydroxychromene-2-carboxylate isomerase
VSDLADGFYFDLASPLAYLAAERVLHVLAAPLPWQPVLAPEHPGAESLDAARRDSEEEILREEVERRVRELGLQPLRWPDPFPFDSSLAMRVATYAKSIGRAVPFAQAAFRQAFAGGHSLEDPDVVLVAAAACEMHPAAVLRGAELRSVRRQLAAATRNAQTAQINEVPALVVHGELFLGERAVEDAAARMRAVPTPAGPPGAPAR